MMFEDVVIDVKGRIPDVFLYGLWGKFLFLKICFESFNELFVFFSVLFDLFFIVFKSKKPLQKFKQ